jgi:hypothetical protein
MELDESLSSVPRTHKHVRSRRKASGDADEDEHERTHVSVLNSRVFVQFVAVNALQAQYAGGMS